MVVASLEGDLADWRRRGLFADEIQDAAWIGLTVEDGCRPAQQLDSIEQVRIELRKTIASGEEAESVLVLADQESSRVHVVDRGHRASRLGEDCGRVPQ